MLKCLVFLLEVVKRLWEQQDDLHQSSKAPVRSYRPQGIRQNCFLIRGSSSAPTKSPQGPSALLHLLWKQPLDPEHNSALDSFDSRATEQKNAVAIRTVNGMLSGQSLIELIRKYQYIISSWLLHTDELLMLCP